MILIAPPKMLQYSYANTKVDKERQTQSRMDQMQLSGDYKVMLWLDLLRPYQPEAPV